MRWIPTLTREEIDVVERYYREHQLELDEQDRLIRERSANRKNPEWVQKVLADARMERLAITESLRHEQSRRLSRNSTGEGLLRTEGALADDPHWDKIMEEIYQERKRASA
jgi:hypothetical protein